MLDCTRRASLAGCVLAFAFQIASPASAQNPLPELFQKAQQEFGAGKHEQSLATIEELDQLSRQPGLENDRRQLIAPIHFFRAANLAMLGRTQDAIIQFQGFLHYNPAAELKKGSFPEPVRDALAKARERMRGGGDIAGVYAAFRSTASTKPLPVTEDWGQTPVRQLLTAEERNQWKSLSDDAAREQFVEAFWKRRDPTPETSANELRQELETRIRFAEEQWTDEERRGSETDRALVFAVLGPPSLIRGSNIEAESEALEALRGRSRDTSGSERSSLRPNLDRGRRELWIYRENRVPDYLRMRELEFEFLTREGYGVGVLDKKGRSSFALGEATKHANETGELN